MTAGNTNNKVAKELSDAMARCKQQGVDEQSLRTGLLTITIANFVNRIGMANTLSLFEALPSQITSGIFDRYIDPNTNTLRSSYPVAAPSQPHSPQAANYAPAAPVISQQPAVPPASPLVQHAVQSAYPYQNTSLPQSFVPPYSDAPNGQTAASVSAYEPRSRRRLPE